MSERRATRLGRAPTAEDIRQHVAGVGQQAGALFSRSDAYWEVYVLETDGEIALVDGSPRWPLSFKDAIFLDLDDQPCPCGGWGDEEVPRG